MNNCYISDFTYTVGSLGKGSPVLTGEVEDLDGLVPPVFNDEVGDVGASGGGEDGGNFHFFLLKSRRHDDIEAIDPVYIDLACLFTSRWHF